MSWIVHCCSHPLEEAVLDPVMGPRNIRWHLQNNDGPQQQLSLLPPLRQSLLPDSCNFLGQTQNARRSDQTTSNIYYICFFPLAGWSTPSPVGSILPAARSRQDWQANRQFSGDFTAELFWVRYPVIKIRRQVSWASVMLRCHLIIWAFSRGNQFEVCTEWLRWNARYRWSDKSNQIVVYLRTSRSATALPGKLMWKETQQTIPYLFRKINGLHGNDFFITGQGEKVEFTLPVSISPPTARQNSRRT